MASTTNPGTEESGEKMKLYSRTIFVFGSNRQGRHGKGAALEARQKHGAIYGQARGLQGNSYAIITKELRPGYPSVFREEIGHQVIHFLRFTEEHPDWQFKVTPIGCGLAGFTPEQIAPLFRHAKENVELPEVFRKVLFPEEKKEA